MLITIMTPKSSFLVSSFFYFLSLVIAAHHATSLSSVVLNPSPRQARQENSVFLAEQNTQPPDYRYACLDQSGVAPSSKYQSNLKSLISSLSSDPATSNGFGNRTEGSDEKDMAYGLYLCRGDVNSSLCHSCVEDSSRLIQQHCPNNATAVLWYPFCLLRYSNQYFFGHLTLKPQIPMFDASQNFSSAEEFDSDARILMNGLIQTVSETNPMFGTHMFNINGTQKRYGWVQCSRDITSEECRTCLSNMLEDVVNCCEGKRVWRIFSPSCIVMYETQPFLVNYTGLIAPTSQPGEESSNRTMLLVIIAISGVVVLTLLVFCKIYFRFLRKKKDKLAVQEDGLNPVFYQDQTDKENNMSADLPTMSLKTILETTCKFSDEYKLGQGGYGSVYKREKNGYRVFYLMERK